MNKSEFLEMQNEFAKYVYRYEYFIKLGVITDSYYHHYFFNELESARYYNLENTLLVELIKMKNDNKTLEEINNYIKGFKDKYANENKTIEEKHKFCEKVVNNCEQLSNDEKAQFEKDYLEYVTNNHPIVKCIVSKEEEALFATLNKLYKENNYDGFKVLLNNNKEIFKPVEIDENEYSRISGYYYDVKKGINNDYANKQNGYPYNKQETMKNDISVARETGEIKVRINTLKSANKQLHKDYVLAFGNDISLK
ncbi:MAG: hypothetical protein IKP77_00680 [Acholeplasmatales bacterium]|nr:hypothetical protein [Acholeplasmatales bacterium]